MIRAALALMLVPLLASAALPATAVRISGQDWIEGKLPEIRVTDLPARSPVTIHAVRVIGKWEQVAGQWQRVPKLIHAWAKVRADRAGSIDLATMTALSGSYTGRDPQGLLWSGYLGGTLEAQAEPLPPTAAAGLASGTVRIIVAGFNGELARTTVQVREGHADLVPRDVRQDGFYGVFAAPVGARKAPTVIVLHGSEGGSKDKATQAVLHFASHGFAALSLIYFNQPYEAFAPNIPTSLENIDVSQLDRAKSWLAAQPEVDPARIGLHGTSKGAELALIAASRFDWVKAAVACVPSDVVWEGGDAGPKLGARPSSWATNGQPLPFVPLIPFVESEQRWQTNTQRYLESRRVASDQATAAQIPVKQIAGDLLLIGADRDEVWASGAMARAIKRMRAKRTFTAIDPLAGHQICGTGAFPARLYPPALSFAGMKSVTAEGAATSRNWRQTIAFLTAKLK